MRKPVPKLPSVPHTKSLHLRRFIVLLVPVMGTTLGSHVPFMLKHEFRVQTFQRMTKV